MAAAPNTGTEEIISFLFELRYRRKPKEGEATHDWIRGTRIYRPFKDVVNTGIPIVALHCDPYERIRIAYHQRVEVKGAFSPNSFQDFCEHFGKYRANYDTGLEMESQVEWLGVDRRIFAASLGLNHLAYLPSLLRHLTGRSYPEIAYQERTLDKSAWEPGLKEILAPWVRPDLDAGWNGVTPDAVLLMAGSVDVASHTAADAAPQNTMAADRYQSVAKWGWYRGEPQSWRRWLSTTLPVRVLEIGAFDGVSANTMLDAVFTHPESTVDAIDPYLPDPTTPLVSGETLAVFEENRRRGSHEDSIHLHHGKSRDILARMWVEGRGESYDVVYVDGSHTAPDVLADAVMAWPLLKPGGTMVFDDYKWGDERLPCLRPREGVDAFESAYARELIPLHRGYQRMYRKVGVPGGLRTSSGEPYEGQIVIVGAYNSGSSLLSSMLECLGFDIGRPTWEDFGESASFRKILVEAFDEKRVMRTMDRGKLVVRLREWLSQLGPYSGALCIKHPLTGMFLPEIQEAFGDKTNFLRILRPIDESIRKLAARRWFPEPEKLQKLIQRETENFFASGKSYVAVEHQRLLASPADELRRLAVELDVDAPAHRIELATRLVRRRGPASVQS